MRAPVRHVLIVIAGLSLGACRQADGPVPAPNQTRQEELVDVARDLQNIASGRDPQGPQDLAADLRKYAEGPDAVLAVDELSTRTAGALGGRNLAEQDAQRLAHNLWLAVEAREMSERQIEALQNDVQALLMSVGVAEESAQQVAAQVGEVQSTVTDRPRRWYELF